MPCPLRAGIGALGDARILHLTPQSGSNPGRLTATVTATAPAAARRYHTVALRHPWLSSSAWEAARPE
jgi:hypothetical protein